MLDIFQPALQLGPPESICTSRPLPQPARRLQLASTPTVIRSSRLITVAVSLGICTGGIGNSHPLTRICSPSTAKQLKYLPSAYVATSS